MKEDLVGILWKGLVETLYMTSLSTVAAMVLGLPLGILLAVTEKGQPLEMPGFNRMLGTLINIVRSFPFIILIVVLLPISRLIVGTTLGSTAAVVPLAIGSAPFLARIIENALKEVGVGKLEAAKAMGASPSEIIVKVLLPEALPSLIRGATLSVITILGFTAVAGAIGAGGLGSLAIRYGYMRFREDVMFFTVALLVLLVQLVQWTGDLWARQVNRRRFRFE